jgi:hypothetical protein
VGYDMEFVKKDPAKEAEYRAVLQKMDALREAEIGVPNELWDEMDRAQNWYFRLNIWGMGAMRKIMAEAGMMDLLFQHEPFPGMAGEEPTFLEVAEQERVLAQFNPAIALPPVYKFCSNDGWVVTPMECMCMKQVWDKLGEVDQRKAVILATKAEDSDGWFEKATEFMAYVERAAAHGGFRVY